MSLDPTHTALGTWSGGRYLHYGVPLEDDRLLALMRPDERIPTVLTADAYGAGEADTMLGRALAGLDRDAYCLVGAVGHDFYDGEREGAKGYPRFTDPRLRGPGEYGAYLRTRPSAASQRIGADAFDLLLLHNPDRTGYTHEAVWEGMAALRDAGLTRRIGVAPGPANGFTLDVIDCFERYGEVIDWAMLILNPFEPWPGELALPAAAAHDVGPRASSTTAASSTTTCAPGLPLGLGDHRSFRPGRLDRGRASRAWSSCARSPQRHDLTLLQLACAVQPRPPGRRVGRADADPGVVGGRQAGRGPARGAGRRRRPRSC